jgi:hypothetical protein
MPGGGLYALVAYGAQNVLLSGNPDFTYFYKSYKKYSHYSEESVSFSMDGPQTLSYDQPIQVRFKIQRVADLVRDMYFSFKLPDIYCKYISLQSSSVGRVAQYNFSWINYIGCHIIQNAAFFIGGQKIQEFDGDYMIMKAQCDYDDITFKKWQKLVGNVPELYDPANGIYAGGLAGTNYPLVYNNNGPNGPLTPNTNRPSIQGTTLKVPLSFWFTESTFEALPLVSLQYHECEVKLTLRPINSLYRVLDSKGHQVAPGFEYNPPPIVLQPENIYYTSVSDISDITINNFLTDIGTPAPLLNTWDLQPHIIVTYVYITDEERKHFSSEPLMYLVRQITSYDFNSIVSRQFLELDVHNPIERLIVVPRRSDSITYRNQIDNYSNWINPLKAPFIQSGYAPRDESINLTSATGTFVLNGQPNIISTFSIQCDGNLLQEEKPFSYYSDVIPYKYLSGLPDSNILVYPFMLSSADFQPTGSINSSRIKLFQLDLNVNPLPANTFYQYNVNVYVESLNWVTVASGMGGLKYAL